MAEENQSVEEQEQEIVVDQTEESTEKVQVAESEDGELENY